jgi:hypothetical protein
MIRPFELAIHTGLPTTAAALMASTFLCQGQTVQPSKQARPPSYIPTGDASSMKLQAVAAHQTGDIMGDAPTAAAVTKAQGDHPAVGDITGDSCCQAIPTVFQPPGMRDDAIGQALKVMRAMHGDGPATIGDVVGDLDFGDIDGFGGDVQRVLH